MSVAITRGIEVRVEVEYVPSRSAPERNVYFFAYHITITNHGDRPAQLVARHWLITDGSGAEEHVRGPGVVGEQPRLLPGESFKYTSFCPLPTEVGTMEGEYLMQFDDGTGFDARIAPFTLAAPHALN
jgi:ApaG protein